MYHDGSDPWRSIQKVRESPLSLPGGEREREEKTEETSGVLLRSALQYDFHVERKFERPRGSNDAYGSKAIDASGDLEAVGLGSSKIDSTVPDGLLAFSLS
jgi:hypothetical protein